MLIEWVHILNSIILLGTAMGSAFFLFAANRSRDVSSIYFVTRHAVRANWIFILPAGIIQPATGVVMMHERDYSLAEGWLLLAVALFLLAMVCWGLAVRLQCRMRDAAKAALQGGNPLPVSYREMDKIWSLLTITAFFSIAAVSYLMVVKLQIAFLSGLVSHGA